MKKKLPNKDSEPRASTTKRFYILKSGAALVIAICTCCMISSSAFAKNNVNTKGSVENNAAPTSSIMESINIATTAANQNFTDETRVGYNLEGVDNSTTCMVNTSSKKITDGSSSILTQINPDQIELINKSIADVLSFKTTPQLTATSESIPAQTWQEGSVVQNKEMHFTGEKVLTYANLKSKVSKVVMTA
jgi:hypothetical protein